jgi:hypothetical protein
VPQPIAIWNRARGVWEVPQTESLICGHSERFSETWPSSGMTHGGSAYALPTLAHRTAGSGSSSLLPTPNAADGMGGPGNSGRDGGLNLRTAAALLPTPTSRDHRGANQRGDETCLTGALLPTPRASDGTKGGPNQRGNSGDLMLPSAVAGIAANPSQAGPIAGTAELLLPTPTASVVQDGEAFKTWEARRKIAAAKHGNNGIGMPLTIAVQLLPTPRSQNGEGRNQNIWARPLDQPQTLENALARLDDDLSE